VAPGHEEYEVRHALDRIRLALVDLDHGNDQVMNTITVCDSESTDVNRSKL